jgi:hypothetical protein
MRTPAIVPAAAAAPNDRGAMAFCDKSLYWLRSIEQAGIE